MSGRARTVLAWVVVAPWALWALIRLFGLERGYPLVPLMAYTPFVVIASILAAGGAALLRRWAPTALGALATGLLLIAVLPRAIADGDPAIANPIGLRILTINTHSSKADPAAIAKLVRENRIDLLSLQELTTQGAAELRRSAVARELQYGLLALRGDAYGSGLFSRYPLRKGGPAATIREIDATVKLPGGSVEVFCVHPVAPTDQSAVRLWQDTFDALPRAEPDGALRVLAGDFNATLDHDVLRDLIASGYRDAGDAEGKGLDFTWPSHRSFPPLVTIDHILADRRIGIDDYAVHDLPGTDHRAVSTSLLLPSSGSGGR
jgi:endonuclease/exonuclease/phosphatase family metal-dependent hydrolase